MYAKRLLEQINELKYLKTTVHNSTQEHTCLTWSDFKVPHIDQMFNSQLVLSGTIKLRINENFYLEKEKKKLLFWSINLHVNLVFLQSIVSNDNDSNAFVTCKKSYQKIIPKLLKTVHSDLYIYGLF